jgi:hypothetical protein
MKQAKTLLAGVIISSVLAQAGVAQIIADFESYTTPTANGDVMFRAPSFSGSTGSKLDLSPNSSIVDSAGIPAGNPNVGNNALLVSFSFLDTNPTPLWLRLTTFNVANQGNPTIGLSSGMGLQFDIHSDTPLFVTALIRETETDAAFGADGGSANGIEFVGGNPTTTTGKAVAADTWTTLLFDFSTDPVAAFAGATANGILEPGVDGKGVLEALGLAVADGTTGDINIWLDNFQVVPEPSTIALSVLGGLGLFFAVRRHRKA